MTREQCQLQDADVKRLGLLPAIPGAAFRFWRELCAGLGLDPKTVICGLDYRFTALPVGHDKRQWCWPSKLKCPKPQVFHA